MGENDRKDGGDERLWPIICGKQWMQLAVEASGAECEVFTPSQAEVVAIEDNVLQCALRMLMEVVAE